jgi:hypothetical protein
MYIIGAYGFTPRSDITAYCHYCPWIAIHLLDHRKQCYENAWENLVEVS